LGIRVRLGLAIGLAAALALALFGFAVVAAHFGCSLRGLGIRVRLGSAIGLAAVLALALFGVAVVTVLFGRSRQCFGHSSLPLDWRLDLRPCSLLPCLVSQLWPHSLVTLCDALGSRFHFGLALGSQQRSLLPCVVLQLWPHSLVTLGNALGSRFHFGSAFGLAAALAPALCGVAVVAALFGHSLRCFGQSIPLWISAWTCSSARSRLVWCSSWGYTLWSLPAMLWTFKSALDWQLDLQQRSLLPG
jgi:hypothetical protein